MKNPVLHSKLWKYISYQEVGQRLDCIPLTPSYANKKGKYSKIRNWPYSRARSSDILLPDHAPLHLWWAFNSITNSHIPVTNPAPLIPRFLSPTNLLQCSQSPSFYHPNPQHSFLTRQCALFLLMNQMSEITLTLQWFRNKNLSVPYFQILLNEI